MKQNMSRILYRGMFSTESGRKVRLLLTPCGLYESSFQRPPFRSLRRLFPLKRIKKVRFDLLSITIYGTSRSGEPLVKSYFPFWIGSFPDAIASAGIPCENGKAFARDSLRGYVLSYRIQVVLAPLFASVLVQCVMPLLWPNLANYRVLGGSLPAVLIIGSAIWAVICPLLIQILYGHLRDRESK
jgi:hypothetical protein